MEYETFLCAQVLQHEPGNGSTHFWLIFDAHRQESASQQVQAHIHYTAPLIRRSAQQALSASVPCSGDTSEGDPVR